MCRAFKRFSLSALILVTSIFLLSSTVLSAPQPYATMSGGSFTYVADNNELTISGGTIGMIQHADGSFAFNQDQDPIWGGTFTFSLLYNSDNTGGGENWIFAPSPSSSPDFTLFDYYGNQRLTAEIYDFTVVQNGSLFEVNVNFDQANVGTITTNPNSPASEFISDVDSFPVPWGELYMKFNFSGTNANDFTEDQFGSVSGTFAVTPEPVSSILFVTGGATLAFRHFRRKKSKHTS